MPSPKSGFREVDRRSAASTLAFTASQAVPVAVIGASVALQSWQEGSILAEHWLPHAVVAALLLVAVLVSGSALRPRRSVVIAIASLAALAAWTAVSIRWSPVPSLARDEALLTALYVVALAVPAVVIRTESARAASVGVLVAMAGGLAVATATRLAVGSDPLELYFQGRLAAPIGYPNAQAAAFLLPLWPALAVAASDRFRTFVRAPAFAVAASVLAGSLTTQSKGGLVALVVSAAAVFLLAPTRVRLLVPTALAGAVVAAGYSQLTAPYRVADVVEEAAIRDAGRAWLLVTAGGMFAGLVYAALDRRVVVRIRRSGLVTAFVAIAVLAGASAALAGSDVSLGQARELAVEKWEEATKPPPRDEDESTHFAELGSNRYDFWRVAYEEFRDHPVAGIGGRAFGPAYLLHRRSNETPTRAHSVWLDVLSETGLVGFAFLLVGIGALLFALAVHGVRDLLVASIAGSAVYFLAHASVDAVWTFPVVAVPFFLLVGIALSRRRDDRIGWRVAVPAAVATLVVVIAGFVPPWLSAQFTERRQFEHARRLDPLSTEPLVAEASLARRGERKIGLLRDAIELEPRSSSLHYLLGRAYLGAGRTRDARVAFLRARSLNPREDVIEDALEELRERGARRKRA